MPALSGSVTFTRFLVEPKKAPAKDPNRALARAIRARAFEPLDRKSEDDESAGWVELEDRDATELAPSSLVFGDQVVISYRIETLRIPAAVVRDELGQWAKAFEDENDRRPRKTEKAQEKQHIVRRLRSRAFIASKTVDVSFGLEPGSELWIWSTSRSLVEKVQDAVEETFDFTLRAQTPGVRAEDLAAKISPTSALFGSEVAGEVGRRV